MFNFAAVAVADVTTTCSFSSGELPIPTLPSASMRSLSGAVSQPPSVELVKNLIPPPTDVAAERFKLLSLVPLAFPHQTEAFS